MAKPVQPGGERDSLVPCPYPSLFLLWERGKRRSGAGTAGLLTAVRFSI